MAVSVIVETVAVRLIVKVAVAVLRDSDSGRSIKRVCCQGVRGEG